jgi:hypothetical protein
MIPDWLPTLLASIALAMGSGLVVWVRGIERDNQKFREDAPNRYASKADISDVKTSVDRLDSRVESMIELLYAIKGQVGALGHDGSK